jgi:hypothetical protein
LQPPFPSVGDCKSPLLEHFRERPAINDRRALEILSNLKSQGPFTEKDREFFDKVETAVKRFDGESKRRESAKFSIMFSVVEFPSRKICRSVRSPAFHDFAPGHPLAARS